MKSPYKNLFKGQKAAFELLEKNRDISREGELWLEFALEDSIKKDLFRSIPSLEKKFTYPGQEHNPAKVVLEHTPCLTMHLHLGNGEEIKVVLPSVKYNKDTHRDADGKVVYDTNISVNMYYFFNEWVDFIEELWKHKPKTV